MPLVCSKGHCPLCLLNKMQYPGLDSLGFFPGGGPSRAEIAGGTGEGRSGLWVGTENARVGGLVKGKGDDRANFGQSNVCCSPSMWQTGHHLAPLPCAVKA